jgi:hypothetical protein
VPAGLVTIRDLTGGGQHLAEVGAEVVGEPGGPQRFEGKGVVVE